MNRNAVAAVFRDRRTLYVLTVTGFFLSWAIPRFGLLDPYVQLILMYVGINAILCLSLNLINGFMGEFSVGHAGFMSAGAYAASLLTVRVFPHGAAWAFPAATLAGGCAAALLGLLVALPSFKTRGDYLAIVTLAFIFIVKSAIENIDAVGGPRGLLGMDRLTTLPWVFGWTVLTVFVIRNFIYSRYGRGVLAVREDETAAEFMGVDTRQVKVLTFVVASFFAGAAGALFAHLLQYISPGMFDIVKSTDMLVMVYLGGVGSIGGSLLGATIYTVLLEALRPLEMWRMVLMPLLLVLLMIFRPRGIMGLREFPWFRRRPEPRGGAGRPARAEAAASPRAQAPLLEVSGLTHRFGGLTAVSGFGLRLGEGELVGIIGPNGAGKTTVFNLITGAYRPDEGRILFAGQDITGRRPGEINAAGIARTFQNIRLFKDLSVLDNIMTAHYARSACGVAEALSHAGGYRADEARVRDHALDLLAFFDLEGQSATCAGSLPYGLQRRLEIVRALATRPRLLLLDEPAAGMHPHEVDRLRELIRRVRAEFAVSILLIEHQMRLVMSVCERVEVLDFGTTIAAGTPSQIQSDPRVLEAYLGQEAAS
ncbi:MAG: branched-chain amino acid ABC transporter ATP-binding protein/permease [Elusimicrobia bacterium]|nr:branched-chain amino acid ABC transporter ATP-binding protein/permease [Elusimicrobiota bacterium]